MVYISHPKTKSRSMSPNFTFIELNVATIKPQSRIRWRLLVRMLVHLGWTTPMLAPPRNISFCDNFSPNFYTSQGAITPKILKQSKNYEKFCLIVNRATQDLQGQPSKGDTCCLWMVIHFKMGAPICFTLGLSFATLADLGLGFHRIFDMGYKAKPLILLSPLSRTLHLLHASTSNRQNDAIHNEGEFKSL